MVLQRFLDALGIDLQARVGQGRLLELGEIDDLARFCRLPLAVLDRELAARSPASGAQRLLIGERVWMRAAAAQPEVDTNSAAIRLRYIRDYLRWLATDGLLRLPRGEAAHSALLAEMDVVLRVLGERIPSIRNRNPVRARQGLDPEAQERLEQVIDPQSIGNPWVGVHARERNALIVQWLRSLGVRRGELLGIRIRDINFQTHEVRITRRADDPTDPRAHQPNTKTNGRLVPLDDRLAELTHRYILGARRTLAGARKHDFLFVANGSGAPLTLSALNKIFQALRSKCPDLPRELSPHVLRHTWNDRFSELMDKHRISEETEQKMRSRLMGWSETSNTAVIYTRRHIQRKAREASLQLQKTLRGKSK